MTDTRLWRCPECLKTFRIRAESPDPDLCKNCRRFAEAEKQSRSTHQHEPPASPIFDDKKNSFLSLDLSLKKITLAICIPFFFCCFGLVLIGMIINVFTPDESKQVREIAPETTITEKKDRNSEQPQNITNRIPIVSTTIKKLAISSIMQNPDVLDAAITQHELQVYLVITVPNGTRKEHAKRLCEDFVRKVKSLSEDNAPGTEIGEGIYDYAVVAMNPNDPNLLCGGYKPKNVTRIKW